MRILSAFVLLVIGCSGSGGENPESDASPLPAASVQIGLPAGSDGLGFAPLAPGAELRLQTFGQGGTHVLLGVRCSGFGNRAFVTLKLRNLESGAEAVTNAPVRPQLLYCHADGMCDLVPILAMTSGLTDPGQERNGVRVAVTASVRNEAGISAETVQEAVLSTADL
jgi:hypothetical protein